MSKKIFPGNFINNLSSYQGEAIVALPGRHFHHKIGYAKIGATGATSFDVIIPSPDKRPDDKPRPDITGLVVPLGAYLYHLGLRVVDMRKDKGYGTPFSGIVGTNTNEIKLANAVATAGGALTATTASTPVIAIANTTVAPGAVRTHPTGIGTQITGSDMTLRVFVENGSEVAGSAITSSLPGGSYVICECAYWVPGEVADESAFGGLPAIVETL